MYLQIIVQKYVALRTHRLLIPGKCILSGIIAFTLRKNTANFLNFQNEYFAHNSKKGWNSFTQGFSEKSAQYMYISCN